MCTERLAALSIVGASLATSPRGGRPRKRLCDSQPSLPHRMTPSLARRLTEPSRTGIRGPSESTATRPRRWWGSRSPGWCPSSGGGSSRRSGRAWGGAGAARGRAPATASRSRPAVSPPPAAQDDVLRLAERQGPQAPPRPVRRRRGPRRHGGRPPRALLPGMRPRPNLPGRASDLEAIPSLPGRGRDRGPTDLKPTGLPSDPVRTVAMCADRRRRGRCQAPAHPRDSFMRPGRIL